MNTEYRIRETVAGRFVPERRGPDNEWVELHFLHRQMTLVDAQETLTRYLDNISRDALTNVTVAIHPVK